MSAAPPRIALATAAGAWEHDEDAELLVAALLGLGVDADPAVWNDPDVDWSVYDLVVIRSAWDYTRHLDRFLSWAERVETTTPLANPSPVLRWNTDKRYLAQLADDGVAVVPTAFLAPGADAATIDAALPPGADVVVKPTVSAGAQDTARHDEHAHDAAVSHASALLGAGRHVMVQPYLRAVDDVGETGMVFLAGAFSHGFRKGALLLDGPANVDGLFAVENITPRAPGAAELSLAHEILERTDRLFGAESLLYARVDVLRGDDGAPMLLELELTEPSFFLEQDSGAPDRAAAAIVDRAGASGDRSRGR